MYRSPTIANLLKSHPKHASRDEGRMKSPIDSPAWRHVDTEVDQSFGEEERNLRFGMSLDSIHPFPHTNTTHSTWSVRII
jgi:hypothetical protein